MNIEKALTRKLQMRHTFITSKIGIAIVLQILKLKLYNLTIFMNLTTKTWENSDIINLNTFPVTFSPSLFRFGLAFMAFSGVFSTISTVLKIGK